MSLLFRIGARQLPRLVASSVKQSAAPTLAAAVNQLNLLNTTEMANCLPEMQVTKRWAGMWSTEQPHHTKGLVQDRVTLVLQLFDKIDPEKLTPEAHFINDLGLDSLDHVEIIFSMEEEFMFEFPDEQWENLLTIKDISQYICDRFDVFH